MSVLRSRSRPAWQKKNHEKVQAYKREVGNGSDVPQPPEVEAAAERLTAIWRAADHRLAVLVADAVRAGERTKEARFRSLRGEVDRQLDAIEASTRAWLQSELTADLPGGRRGRGRRGWVRVHLDQVHVEAVEALAARSWDDILSATRFIHGTRRRR